MSSLTLSFLFSKNRRTLLIGRNVYPSNYPSAGIRNPKRHLWFAWSWVFAWSYTFNERLRSNMESSIINTFAQSCESSKTIVSLMIWVVKCIQLIWIIFVKRYTVSFAPPRIFRPITKAHVHTSVRKNQYEKILKILNNRNSSFIIGIRYFWCWRYMKSYPKNLLIDCEVCSSFWVACVMLLFIAWTYGWMIVY